MGKAMSADKENAIAAGQFATGVGGSAIGALKAAGEGQTRPTAGQNPPDEGRCRPESWQNCPTE